MGLHMVSANNCWPGNVSVPSFIIRVRDKVEEPTAVLVCVKRKYLTSNGFKLPSC